MKIVEILHPARILTDDVLSKVRGTADLVSSTMCGLEFELEGCNVPIEPRTVGGTVLKHGVTAHVDGSLRNGGIELVTPPVGGLELVKTLDYVLALATAHGWVTSNRAGMHVHVNCQDLTAAQLKSYVIGYLLVEPLLMEWAGEGRAASIYCKPWYRCDDGAPIGKFLRQLAAGAAPEHMPTRYTSLNLDSIYKYGTLEFRQLRSTLDRERLLKWVNILLTIRKWAEDATPTFEYLSAATCGQVASDILGPLYADVRWEEYDSWYMNHTLPLVMRTFFPPKAKRTWVNGGAELKPDNVYVGYIKYAQKQSKIGKPKAKKKPQLFDPLVMDDAAAAAAMAAPPADWHIAPQARRRPAPREPVVAARDANLNDYMWVWDPEADGLGGLGGNFTNSPDRLAAGVRVPVARLGTSYVTRDHYTGRHVQGRITLAGQYTEVHYV